MVKFKLKSNYKPAGDQPKAIEGLVSGLQKRMGKQTLLGVTGSGKTFTMANVVEQVQLPTLVIAHNKTLAAQLCNEFREFFPDNAVEYFVSYYDYYQPEAYLPSTDTYIEKEAMINDEIDRLRHACTQALLSRSDVLIVASVSAIYGLGSPTEYEKIVLHLRRGDELDRRAMLEQLVAMQFERTTSELKRGSFRLHGQVFEIMPVNEDAVYRLEIGSHIERIEIVDRVTRNVKRETSDVWFFPAKHYVVGQAARERAFTSIRRELDEQLAKFERQGKVLEHERLRRRVTYDLEMIKNIGYCNGIENYSWHFEGRAPGEPPFTLLDYFWHCVSGSDPTLTLPLKGEGTGSPLFKEGIQGRSTGFLTIIDESHVTIPQIRGMFHGDRARKDTLVAHGFRLPSARDNRPLTFEEFEARVEQTIYSSATPGEFEIKESDNIVEQIVRPTGLIDPEIIIRPITGKSRYPTAVRRGPAVAVTDNPDQQMTTSGIRKSELSGNPDMSQVEDLIIRIEERIKQGERVLVTTLTKKMAEDLTDYLKEKKMKVAYLHSDIDTLERIEILMNLRLGKIDVLVGINLLREGLDLPEVSLVAVLDADKEGFLRSETSLIQTIGRAARNVNGQVVLYADNITGSIQRAIDETQRRRKIQLEYNKKHGITPKTIQKAIRNILEEFGISAEKQESKKARKHGRTGTLDLDLLGDARPLPEIIRDKERQMKEAAKDLEFELAVVLRDELRELRAREITADMSVTSTKGTRKSRRK